MPTTAKELEDQIALRRARFESIVAEIRAVLVDDIPNWAVREAKEAFLARPEVAASLGQDAVKAFKAAVVAYGSSTAAELAELLVDQDAWLAGAHTSGNPRTMHDAGVWQRISSLVDASFNALLSEHGVAAEEPRSFKGPVYFVGGRYFPALAEHYWKLRSELVDLQAEADELSAQETRATLLQRWEDA